MGVQGLGPGGDEGELGCGAQGWLRLVGFHRAPSGVCARPRLPERVLAPSPHLPAAGRKSCAVTCAKRLSEFLGDGRIKDKVQALLLWPFFWGAFCCS